MNGENMLLLEHNSLGLNTNMPAGLLFIMPFSNATIERIFSVVKDVKTDHRSRLDTDPMVGILSAKDGLKSKGGAVNFVPTEQM
nr:unnamed protein product [Callosobruchus analis]